MVGIEPNDPLQECLGRAFLILARANVDEQRQRADMQGRAREDSDKQALCLRDASGRLRRSRLADLRLLHRRRPSRRPVERATAIRTEAAAAGANRPRVDRRLRGHRRYLGEWLGAKRHVRCAQLSWSIPR